MLSLPKSPTVLSIISHPAKEWILHETVSDIKRNAKTKPCSQVNRNGDILPSVHDFQDTFSLKKSHYFDCYFCLILTFFILLQLRHVIDVLYNGWRGRVSCCYDTIYDEQGRGNNLIWLCKMGKMKSCWSVCNALYSHIYVNRVISRVFGFLLVSVIREGGVRSLSPWLVTKPGLRNIAPNNPVRYTESF